MILGNRLQVFCIMFTLWMLGPKKIGRRGFRFDRIEVSQAKGIGMKGRGEQGHLAWPIKKGRSNFSGIDDLHVLDTCLLQCNGYAQTGGPRTNDEHACPIISIGLVVGW